MRSLIRSLLLLQILAACSSAPTTPSVEVAPPAPLPDGILMRARSGIGEDSLRVLKEPYAQARAITVYVATNRERETTERGDSLLFGRADVWVPGNHPIGTLGEDFKSGSLEPLAIEDWKAAIRKNTDWGILVFVHGFNVTFPEALLRAAQIAYDMKFQGQVVLFSWPAGARGGFFEKNLILRTYERNLQNARESIDAATRVFEELLSLSIPVQVLVHSMGHQVVVPALQRASTGTGAARPWIQELILNAPDLDPSEFEAAREGLGRVAKRITIYCSRTDQALRASKAFHGSARLGSCSAFAGVDVINVSEVDDPGLTGLGHGYYSSRPVLTDIYQVILGIPAERRLFMRASSSSAQENFILRR